MPKLSDETKININSISAKYAIPMWDKLYERTTCASEFSQYIESIESPYLDGNYDAAFESLKAVYTFIDESYPSDLKLIERNTNLHEQILREIILDGFEVLDDLEHEEAIED